MLDTIDCFAIRRPSDIAVLSIWSEVALRITEIRDAFWWRPNLTTT
jgi:hypothetical protein